MSGADGIDPPRRLAPTDPLAVAMSLPGPSSSGPPVGADDFRLLAENIPTLCWMADPTGYIFWYNRRWHEYCGTTPAQMQGWGWQSVHDAAVLPAVLAGWTASIASGEPFEMTFPLRGADGVMRPFLTRVEPLRDADGAVLRWFGINTEISARMAIEARLQAASAERDAMLAQLGDGVIVTDRDGRITFVNQAAARLHDNARIDVDTDDYSRSYGLYTEDGRLHPVDDLPLTRAVRRGEVVTDARWRIRHADGREIVAIGSARRFYAEDGATLGAVLTIHDDTKRHAAETALADAIKRKEMMLHEVNHRVANSLQLVTSLLSMQASQAASEELHASLMEARARIAGIASVHQQLYTTSQHDRVDLAVYLRGLAEQSIEALSPDGRIALDFDGQAEVTLALDQAVPTALIVSELLTNALKYAFRGRAAGRIRLTVAKDGDTVDVSVADDGNGLPPGFEIGTSRGLGMRIIKALAGQLDSALAVHSSTAETRFQLRFAHRPHSALG